MNLKCSIIVPVLNSAETIELCLRSIFEQSFKNYELIIIDGLSTDGTIEKINKFSRSYNNITIISEKDDGVYHAMNKGIQKARGDYIYFLGSNDRLFANDVLSKIFENRFNTNLDVLYGNVYSEFKGKVYDGEFNYFKLYNKNICHQAIFYKRSIFYRFGMFDTRYPIFADWDYNIKWFYSSATNYQFMDLTIAFFSKGGLSQIKQDEVFLKNKDSKFIFRGIGKLSLPILISIYDKEILKAKQHRKYGALIYLIPVNILIKIILRIQRFISPSRAS